MPANDDLSAQAWLIVQRVRDTFVGRKTQPDDADWAAEIEAGLARAGRGGSYDDGYDDALDEIEDAVRNEKSTLRRRRNARPAATLTAVATTA